ncbi:hypothetical protein [Pseudanabaena sp. PCC 6802]|uniref:hypothetical protein n=1 Tax=Pseudanabaena sp. PCC 6802 TaxID=118173 RepID=UPI00034BA756|nr:hypothetical protein [Pseudanabaena sp. PCC 6802]
MTTSSSSVEDLSKAIEGSNLFAIKFADHQHVWGKSFPDATSINAMVSDVVFEAITKVDRGELPSVGITITAEKGTGKTHIISRIRHLLQADGKAFFVYMGNYGNPDCIKHEFLQTLVSSLKKIGSQEVSQWQELAVNLLREVTSKKAYSSRQAVIGVTKELAKDPTWIDRLHKALLPKKPDVDNPYLLKAILWTLSEHHKSYAVNWLAGEDLADGKAVEMGLPNSPNQKQEVESFNFACQILDLISDYITVVFCFDELDDPGDNKRGFTRAQVVYALAKDLRNRIKRCVLLMATYPDTFRDQIKQLPVAGAAFDRTADRVLELEYLNPDSVVDLVSQWLAIFYKEKELVPPNPVYPFDVDELREIGKEKPTARRVLMWCSENFTTKKDVISPDIPLILPPDPIEVAFNNEMAAVEEDIDEYMENNEVIADALWLGIASLIDEETVEGVAVKNIEEIEASKADQGYLHFRIIGEESGRVVKIGVAVLQQSAGRFIGAALKRLIDYKKFGFTRGCLIRSKTINRGAAIPRDCVRKLLQEQGGEWVFLQSQDIKPLLAILFVYNSAENYELTEDSIFNFIAKRRLATDNPLIREILSDPSGQEPENLIDEDMPVSIPKSTSDLDDSIDDIQIDR